MLKKHKISNKMPFKKRNAYLCKEIIQISKNSLKYEENEKVDSTNLTVCHCMSVMVARCHNCLQR